MKSSLRVGEGFEVWLLRIKKNGVSSILSLTGWQVWYSDRLTGLVLWQVDRSGTLTSWQVWYSEKLTGMPIRNAYETAICEMEFTNIACRNSDVILSEENFLTRLSQFQHRYIIEYNIIDISFIIFIHPRVNQRNSNSNEVQGGNGAELSIPCEIYMRIVLSLLGRIFFSLFD